jgi:hypothetical protein
MRELTEEWHGLLALTQLAVLIISIACAGPNKTLTRIPYAIRTIGFFVFAVALLLAGFIYEISLGGGVGIFVVVIGASALYVLWSVYRTQDIGWSRWWNLLLFIPITHLVWVIILIIMPGDDLRHSRANFVANS